jgi:site-specific DNA-methyltransferase (adenine-specific)
MAGYMATSARTDWATPQALFDALDARFGFTLDAAATAENAKCSRYFTPEDDALAQSWREPDGSPAVVWVNPPYGRDLVRWVKKARQEAEAGSTVVLLVPVRTDTRWFHEEVLGCPLASVEFMRGRVKFVGAPAGAPFPTMLVLFEPRRGP